MPALLWTCIVYETPKNCWKDEKWRDDIANSELYSSSNVPKKEEKRHFQAHRSF